MGNEFEISARAFRSLSRKGDCHSRCHTAVGAKQGRTNNVTSGWLRLHRRPGFSKLCRVFFCSVFLTLLRPLYLSFNFSRSISSTEAILSMLYQHTLILALGASIIWTVHADHRHDWLRSRSLLTNKPAAKRKNRCKQACQTRRQRRKSQVCSNMGRIGRGY